MPNTDQTREKGTRAYRLITAVVGALFSVVSVTLLVVTELTMGPVLAAVVLGFLGVDAIMGAWYNRPSLLARIGPWP
ncbi:hypothetical protein [Hydrogenophaga sp.]|uniref:hypothetical protein n=1 Tax=Hydrogenophaga sp. TaxID=1904254 RepID=UPI0025C011B2|nr:hypothetical protein [Hydrogenophaga sp.]